MQLEVLNQIAKPALVGLDTMNYWIEKTPADLKAVIKRADLLIINDGEARELSGELNLIKAAKKILGMMKGPVSRGRRANQKSDALIIKRGEYGLLMFQQNKIFCSDR